MKRFLLLFLLSLSIQAACIPPPNTYDWEAQRWQSQTSTNSGTLTDSSYRAGTYFMQRSKWWGIRPLLGRVNLYLGSDTNAALVPIIRDFFTSNDRIDDTVGFVAADYSEATGYTGGSGKYLRPNGAGGTTMNVANAPHTNIHMAVYCRTSNNGNQCEMGEIDGTSQYSVSFSESGNCVLRLGTDLSTSTANTNTFGFLLSTRTATNFAACYRNGTSILSRAVNTAGSTAPANYLVVHAVNSVGTLAQFSTKSQCYYALGFGVPADRVVPYYTLVHNVQAMKNRNVE